MNRAVAWRMHAQTVRYDYAPRSWEPATPRWRLGDLTPRGPHGPSITRGLRVGFILAMGLGLIYAGMSFRIRYLGDGTLRFERKTAWSLNTVASDGSASALTLIGAELTTGSTPTAPEAPGVVDAAPPRSNPSESRACRENRSEIETSVARYNRKYPGTQIRDIRMLTVINDKLAQLRSGCPASGVYSLEFQSRKPSVTCTAHR